MSFLRWLGKKEIRTNCVNAVNDMLVGDICGFPINVGYIRDPPCAFTCFTVVLDELIDSA